MELGLVVLQLGPQSATPSQNKEEGFEKSTPSPPSGNLRRQSLHVECLVEGKRWPQLEITNPPKLLRVKLPPNPRPVRGDRSRNQ